MDEPFLPPPDKAELRLDIKPTAAISLTDANLIANLNDRNNWKRLSLRCNSPPADFFTGAKGKIDLDTFPIRRDPPPDTNTAPLRLAIFGVLYFGIGIAAFMLGEYDVKSTVRLVDAIYYVVVTLSTIGYGDIAPTSTFTKLFTCFFILLGFGFVAVILNGVVLHVCDRCEAVWLRAMGGRGERRFIPVVVETYLAEKYKGRMRVSTKAATAALVVVVCVGAGVVAARFFEGLSWVDSFYLSVTSVTTVGYGNKSFITAGGRSFAAVWLLMSTVAVARAILYLSELRIDMRNRRRPLRSISQSEFMIYKLRQMRKIAESDVREIFKQFDLLEHSNFSLRLSKEQKMVI